MVDVLLLAGAKGEWKRDGEAELLHEDYMSAFVSRDDDTEGFDDRNPLLGQEADVRQATQATAVVPIPNHRDPQFSAALWCDRARVVPGREACRVGTSRTQF